MKSSVEQLIELLYKAKLIPEDTHPNNILFSEAKKKHKAEIETAYDKVSMLTAEEYYNETFKN